MTLASHLRPIALLGALATGCVYIDPINQHPRIMNVGRACDAFSLLPCDANFEDVHRGDTITFTATFHDPDGPDNRATYRWRMFVCTQDGACDANPVYDGTKAAPAITVPMLLAAGTPVQLVRVELEILDDRGATDAAFRTFTINSGPILDVRADVPAGSSSYALGGPIALFATYGDPDGSSMDVRLDWSVTSPDGHPSYTLTDRAVVQNPDDLVRLTAGKTLVPGETGTWDVGVIATDARGKQKQVHQPLIVASDQPPCIAQWQPIAVTGTAGLPISQPTLFQIPLVTDDLDPYPATAGGLVPGAATFAWSILRPGQTVREPLASATGNSVALDPRAFTPGDRVELRVEIADRIHAAVTCPDDQPTCSSDRSGCLQRQTWRVEAR